MLYQVYSDTGLFLKPGSPLWNVKMVVLLKTLLSFVVIYTNELCATFLQFRCSSAEKYWFIKYRDVERYSHVPGTYSSFVIKYVINGIASGAWLNKKIDGRRLQPE